MNFAIKFAQCVARRVRRAFLHNVILLRVYEAKFLPRIQALVLKPFSIAVALPVRATDFNLLKNQSRGHAKKAKCSSTSKRVRAHKSRQKRPELNTCIQQKLKHIRSSCTGKTTAIENGLYLMIDQSFPLAVMVTKATALNSL